MKNRFNFFLVLAGCVFLAWLIFPRFLARVWGDGSAALLEVLSAAGPVGDSFGALNSLFTGLALAALVYAILVQVEQLKKQEENLALYKEEVEKTIAHLEQEDRWNRLKLKMEVLPHLSARAEHRIRGSIASANRLAVRSGNALLAKDTGEFSDIASTSQATERVRDWIVERLSKVQEAVEECTEKLDAGKAFLDESTAQRLKIERLLSDESAEAIESAKECHAILSQDALINVRRSMTEREGELATLKEMRAPLESALKDAEELLAYQADLEAAYHEARRA